VRGSFGELLPPSLNDWGMSFAGIGTAVAIAILTAELAGYVMHRVMHSERFPVLSRAHMIRHFELYGPAQSMRSAVYRRATDGRASLGNIGMEWVVPSAITLGTCWAVMWVLHVAWKYEVLVWPSCLAGPCSCLAICTTACPWRNSGWLVCLS
jgi:hypothetical protein